MLRLAAALALALSLSGCAASSGSSSPPASAPPLTPTASAERVDLLTGVSTEACYAGGETGYTAPLLVDPKYGTSFRGHPVMWPDGFTARHAGDEIAVLNATGKVFATTGRLYRISAGFVTSAEKRVLMDQLGAWPAAAVCDYPWDFVDCGTPARPSPPTDALAIYCSGEWDRH